MGEGEAVEALQNQRLDIVNHQFGPAMIGEAGGEAPGDIQALVGAAQQGDTAVGGDDAAGEVGLDGPLRKAFGSWVPHARLDTPRNPPGRSLNGHKSLYVNDLESTNTLLDTRV